MTDLQDSTGGGSGLVATEFDQASGVGGRRTGAAGPVAAEQPAGTASGVGGVVLPNLDLSPLLVLGGLEALHSGKCGDSSVGTAPGWRTAWYVAAGEATISYSNGRQGDNFRMVTDRDTGERLRGYQFDQLEAQEQAHFDGMREARTDGEYTPRVVELLAEREYWRRRGCSVPPLPASVVLSLRSEPCTKCRARSVRSFRRSELERRAHAERVHAQRAASTVRRFCRAWRIDHLWTLTYAGEGQRDYRQLRRHMTKFFREFKSRVGDRPLVAVREPHPGGHGWHVHFGVSGWVSVRVIRQCWTHGSVNVKGRKQGSSPRKVAGYIAKYVSKGLNPVHCEASGVSDRLPGEHRYWVSQGFPVVPVVYVNRRQSDACEQLEALAGVALFVWDSASVAEWRGPPCLWLDLVGDGLDCSPSRGTSLARLGNGSVH